MKWLLPFWAVWLLVSPAVAQAPPEENLPAEDDVFLERMDVNLVNVEVFVTGKGGEPVRGLTAEDFEVLEDDRPQKITNFFVVEDGEAKVPASVVEEQEATAEGEAKAPKPSPVQANVPEEIKRLNLVIYIDNYNIRPFNRNRVFRAIRVFLQDNLTPGDQVMLVSYDRSLHVRQEFTSDTRLITQGLFELETVSGHGVHLDSDRRDLLQAIAEADYVGEVYSRARTYIENLFNDLSFTITNLHDFVSSLAGLPGRRALLYVSDGVPMRAGEDIFARLNERWRDDVSQIEAFDFDASRRWQALSASANSNQVTLYTLDAAGLRAPTAASVENNNPGATLFVDQIHISNIQGPLLMMAEETGGQAIINTNDPTKALAKVAQDFKSYYSIGYLPAHSGDGRYHRIKVKVKGRKGLDVRHRDGYRDKSPAARMADGTLSSLRWGIENNPMGVTLGLGKQAPRPDGYYNVEVLLEIPLSQVVLIPRDANHEARLKVFFSASDTEGGIAPVQETALPIRIPNHEVERAKTQLYLYKVNLMMKPGQHRIAAGVSDEVGQVASFLRRGVRVGR